MSEDLDQCVNGGADAAQNKDVNDNAAEELVTDVPVQAAADPHAQQGGRQGYQGQQEAFTAEQAAGDIDDPAEYTFQQEDKTDIGAESLPPGRDPFQMGQDQQVNAEQSGSDAGAERPGFRVSISMPSPMMTSPSSSFNPTGEP